MTKKSNSSKGQVGNLHELDSTFNESDQEETLIRQPNGRQQQLIDGANAKLLAAQVRNLLTAIDLIRTGQVTDRSQGYRQYLDGVVNTAKLALDRCTEKRDST